MNVSIPSIQKNKIGTCPHGLPAGACPICNGMGGGGGATKKADLRAGEMSWDECYAVWQQMLKAKDLAQQKRNEALQSQMQNQISFTSKLENVAQKIANLSEKLVNFVQKTQANPTIKSKLLALTAKIAIPILNVLKNIPIFAQKAITFIKEKLTDISDKLNAVFGELKNAVEKKISERLKDFKKKFKSIFGIFEPEEIEDEEKKVEKNKRVFEFKNIFKLIKNKKEIKDGTGNKSD